MAKYPVKTIIKVNSEGRPAKQLPKTASMKPVTSESIIKIPISNIIKTMTPPAPRDSCQDCTRKHIAQAIILLQESLLGYPEHKWLAIGHMAEASEECLGEFPAVAQMIRKDRLAITDNKGSDLMRYLRDDFNILTTESAPEDSQ